MTATLKVPFTEDLAGLRMHRAVAPEEADGRVKWLLSLHEREQQRQALHSLAVTTTQCLEALPLRVGERLDEIAALSVELGIAIAREIVGDSLDRGHVDPTPTVARCLRDCVHGRSPADLVVRLHPEDVAIVQKNLAEDASLQEQFQLCKFVGDPEIQRGAVRAETESGRLRYDPREALERVSDEVRREVRG